MVGIGMLMLFTAWLGVYLVKTGKLANHPWYQRLCFCMGPAGFIAVIAGWFTAEVGRQPYTVYGLLRTVDSVSPVTANAVGMSLSIFIFTYAIIFTAGVYYLFQLAWSGPTDSGHLSDDLEARPNMATTLMVSESGYEPMKKSPLDERR